ncbi:MAG: vWA domain-containing protein [Verrucomicrobiales bacterium]
MMKDYEFADPAWFWALLLVPVFFFALGGGSSRRGLRYGGFHLLGKIGTMPRTHSWGARWSWLIPAYILAVTAMARPQKLEVEEQREYSGIDIMIALDVSRSMTAVDFVLEGERKDRLVAAKAVCKEFIRGRPNDRIGMVAFAGRPYPVSVPILNHDWVLERMAAIRIGMVEDGTAIGSAIASGASRLNKQKSKSRILVLITDGKSNAGELDPLDAARQAAALGIRIYTITVGGTGTTVIRIPDEFGGERLARLTNEYDPATMAEIARLSGGQSYRAEATANLRDAFSSIDTLEKSTLASRSITHRQDVFAWFLLPAVLLVLLDCLRPLPEERALPA